MNPFFEERNKTSVRIFGALYGTMPTMTLYARIGHDFHLSEETVRKIVRRPPLTPTPPTPSKRGLTESGDISLEGIPYPPSPSFGGVGEV